MIFSRYYAAAGIGRHETKKIFYLKYINPPAEFIIPHRITARYTNANTCFKHVHDTVSHVTGGPFSYSSEMRSSRSIPNLVSVVMLLCTDNVGGVPKVSNGAKIRNRYNQVPHLTQDTNGKVTNSQKTPQTRAKRPALSQGYSSLIWFNVWNLDISLANRKVGHLVTGLGNHIYLPCLSEQYSSCPKDGQNWQYTLGKR